MVLFYSLISCGCQSKQPPVSAKKVSERSEVVIRRFCGDCHPFPEPDTYPRALWPEKVREGFHFYHASLRTDLEVPEVSLVEQFYAAAAPLELTIQPSQLTAFDESGSIFSAAEHLNLPSQFSAVAQLQSLRESQSKRPLLISDMQTGNVFKLLPSPAGDELNLITKVLNACCTQSVDLDQDGELDFVVADLGSFLPEDHNLGAVWFVTRDMSSGQFQQIPLVQGLGRVAEVQAVDIERDGDLDLLVAEFGWRNTGRILLLRNQPTADGRPQMAVETLDERHGAINLPVTDLNGDGSPDFIALISQEHEVIEAFINRGDGTFTKKTIYQSDNPGFGSSNMQLADIDSDGDLDIVYVNGDSLDTPIAKPYHGLRWLENDGTFPYTVHEISPFPGAHCVRAGDLDGDDDIDLAVVSLLPEAALNSYPQGTFDSVAWFEQTDDNSFVGHSLQKDHCLHATCELWDYDGDGDLDLVTAAMLKSSTAKQPLTLFENLSIQNSADQ